MAIIEATAGAGVMRAAGAMDDGARAGLNAADARRLAQARDLLARADALAARSGDAATPSDVYRELYLAALRGAGAVLALYETRRRPAGGAWTRLTHAVPGMADAAQTFAGPSRTRAAIDAGARRDVTDTAVSALYADVMAFLDGVGMHLDVFEAAGGSGRRGSGRVRPA